MSTSHEHDESISNDGIPQKNRFDPLVRFKYFSDSKVSLNSSRAYLNPWKKFYIIMKRDN